MVFHGKHHEMSRRTILEYARSAATWAGVSLSPDQEEQLLRFAEWLVEEAIPAGGLGPDEAARVGNRHLGDSLLFAGGWRDQPPPETLIDLGSGVGLPGIPLAIVMPSTSVRLLDRSGRRCRLAGRALRVLGLENVAVSNEEVGVHRRRYHGVVARALYPPRHLMPVLARVLLPTGVAVLGERWGDAQPETRPPAGMERIIVPGEVLDSPIGLLRMTGGAG